VKWRGTGSKDENEERSRCDQITEGIALASGMRARTRMSVCREWMY
jgi:hypothetical protein